MAKYINYNKIKTWLDDHYDDETFTVGYLSEKLDGLPVVEYDPCGLCQEFLCQEFDCSGCKYNVRSMLGYL